MEFDKTKVRSKKMKILKMKILSKNFSNEEFELDFANTAEKLRYMMLSRMQSDCEYYLGNAHKNPRCLWTLKEEKQIKYMVSLYNSLIKKPEWLTLKQINNYSKELTGKTLSGHGWLNVIGKIMAGV